MLARRRGSEDSGLPRGVQVFLHSLKRSLTSRFPDVAVYLTGSYASGEWLDDSDIDLIIVSEGFKGMELGRRYNTVKKLAPPGFSLDILAYTPEEYAQAKRRSFILRDMMNYAHRVA